MLVLKPLDHLFKLDEFFIVDALNRTKKAVQTSNILLFVQHCILDGNALSISLSCSIIFISLSYYFSTVSICFLINKHFCVDLFLLNAICKIDI